MSYLLHLRIPLCRTTGNQHTRFQHDKQRQAEVDSVESRVISSRSLTRTTGIWFNHSYRRGNGSHKRGDNQQQGGTLGCLLAIGIVIIIFWLLGFTVLNLGALIHIALVIGVIFIILWLLKAVFKLF